MGIADGALALEKRLRRLIDDLFGKGAPVEPLDLRRAVLDEVAERVTPVGGGDKRFPFNRLTVQFAAPDDERRSLLEAAFAEGQKLEADIRERLRREGCAPPEDLRVKLTFVRQPGKKWGRPEFNVAYSRARQEEATDATTPLSRPPLQASLYVLRGRGSKKRYAVGQKEFHVGRGEEVRRLSDDMILRRNDLAFADDDEHLGLRISRSHADVFFDQGASEFRLRDVGSEYGTYIVRDGETFTVPKGDRHGVRLRPGDEIEFGQARVRFEVKQED